MCGGLWENGRLVEGNCSEAFIVGVGGATVRVPLLADVDFAFFSSCRISSFYLLSLFILFVVIIIIWSVRNKMASLATFEASVLPPWLGVVVLTPLQ
jgi:hypothetical protein